MNMVDMSLHLGFNVQVMQVPLIASCYFIGNTTSLNQIKGKVQCVTVNHRGMEWFSLKTDTEIGSSRDSIGEVPHFLCCVELPREVV